MNNLFVILLGMGTVFVGLITIVILCKLVGWFCQFGAKKEDADETASPTAPAPAVTAPTAKAEIPNRRETVAAIAAAIAEDLGADVSAIRILSIEQM